MTEKYTRFNTIINDIEFKMIRKNKHCWIKAVPNIQVSTPSSLHIILKGDDHHWDVYDESGEESHKVYFKGYETAPSFYLKSGENCYRVDCNYDDIKVLPINKTHKMNTYLKNYCNCTASQASCWAVALGYTNRPEKHPFNEM